MSANNRVTIKAVGDIMLGDSPKCIGIGVRSATENKGASFLFAQVREFLGGDIVFGNLECVLSDHDYNRFSFRRAQMRGYPESIKAVREAGFNVLSVANNHMMQHGETGFLETCRLLEETGIGIVGMRGNEGYLCKPLFIDVDDTKVGLVGYAQEIDKYTSAATLYAQGSPEQIASDVQKIREICDYVVVSMHWGDEFVSKPSNSTINLARTLIDSGAHVVLGHHPHVVQHSEIYKKGTIIYSLGNFITDMVWDVKLMDGVIVDIVCENGTTRIGKVFSTNILPDLSVVVSGCGNINAIQCGFQLECVDSELYVAEVNSARVANRNKSYRYIINNIFNYKLLIVLQIALCATISLFGNILSKIKSLKMIVNIIKTITTHEENCASVTSKSIF